MTAVFNPLRTRIVLIVAVCAAIACVVALAPGRARAGSTATTTFTTPGEHAWAIPLAAVALRVTVIGGAGANGSGGAPGGAGASVTATIPVGKLTIVYAEVGAPGTPAPATGGATGSASTGGGGGGSGSGTGGTGGGGGGSSDIRTCGLENCPFGGVFPDTRLIVAGGGGGGGGGGVSTSGGSGGAAASAGIHGQALSSQPGGGGGGAGTGETGGAGSGGSGSSNACDQGLFGYGGGKGGYEGSDSGTGVAQPGGAPSGPTPAPGGQAIGGGGGGGFGYQSGGGGGGGGGGFNGGGGGGGGAPCDSGGSGGGGGGGGGNYVISSATEVSMGTSSQAPEVSITPVFKSAPLITSASAATFRVGQAGSFAVTATGYPPPKFSLKGQPSWLSIDASSGVISGTPPTGAGGVYKFTVIAFNGVSPKAKQAFKLKVDQAPAITSANSAKWVAGKAQKFQVKATGYPAPTFRGTGLPSWLKLSSSGTLMGTPPASAVGAHTISIKARNAMGSVVQPFTLDVVPAPPSATIASPHSGQTFSVHQAVLTTFRCREGLGGPGLKSCDDSNDTNTVGGGNGHLDTSHVGKHVYTVTARSKDGQSSKATITYEVAK